MSKFFFCKALKCFQKICVALTIRIKESVYEPHFGSLNGTLAVIATLKILKSYTNYVVSKYLSAAKCACVLYVLENESGATKDT